MSDLVAFAREHGVAYFLICFADLNGVPRAKLVPSAAIATMSSAGAGFAGFATWLEMTPADPDVLAIPDPESVTILPWKPDVAWVAADPWMRGEPVAHAPRNVLKRVLARVHGAGFTMKTGVECEFFLLDPTGAISDPADVGEKPCYDQQALMRRFDVIAEICNGMQSLGWGPYQNDHEDGNGQFELNWTYADALRTADRHLFFKFMTKSIAEKHGLRATFMPKPFAHLTGNGAHTHVSLWDVQGERNQFLSEADPHGLAPRGYHFIGGLLHAAPALCALTNPTVNSYKRLGASNPMSGATWAPRTATYGGNNRTHMIRIPDAGRFELRLPDGAANPYLLPAAIATAGLEGIAGARDPGSPLDVNMDAEHERPPAAPALPQNLLDALRALETNTTFAHAFGAPFVEAYARQKRREWYAFCGELTAWERRTTLDC